MRYSCVLLVALWAAIGCGPESAVTASAPAEETNSLSPAARAAVEAEHYSALVSHCEARIAAIRRSEQLGWRDAEHAASEIAEQERELASVHF